MGRLVLGTKDKLEIEQKEISASLPLPEILIKEVIKEVLVPFEVIKEVPVPFEVVKEVIIEKQVPFEIIKLIPKEVIKEVIKEVPVETIKEIVKEKTIEVPRLVFQSQLPYWSKVVMLIQAGIIIIGMMISIHKM